MFNTHRASEFPERDPGNHSLLSDTMISTIKQQTLVTKYQVNADMELEGKVRVQIKSLAEEKRFLPAASEFD